MSRRATTGKEPSFSSIWAATESSSYYEAFMIEYQNMRVHRTENKEAITSLFGGLETLEEQVDASEKFRVEDFDQIDSTTTDMREIIGVFGRPRLKKQLEIFALVMEKFVNDAGEECNKNDSETYLRMIDAAAELLPESEILSLCAAQTQESKLRLQASLTTSEVTKLLREVKEGVAKDVDSAVLNAQKIIDAKEMVNKITAVGESEHELLIKEAYIALAVSICNGSCDANIADDKRYTAMKMVSNRLEDMQCISSVRLLFESLIKVDKADT